MEKTLSFEEIIQSTGLIPMRSFQENRKINPLDMEYPIIGEGTTRIVFDIGDGLVLKVSDTPLGMVENYNEFLLSTVFGSVLPILTPVVWVNKKTVDDCRYLIMKHGAVHNPEWAEEFTEEKAFDFLECLGVDINELVLASNSVGLNLVDYGGTVDSNPIDLSILKHLLKED